VPLVWKEGKQGGEGRRGREGRRKEEGGGDGGGRRW